MGGWMDGWMDGSTDISKIEPNANSLLEESKLSFYSILFLKMQI
jgi:hypothetical protein